mmetsp:Transcript_9742/g.20591  ORF Transcript_9742/g.20591 Transcript_9742/m.20591 type:complete len:197 (-) Transcript_9742:76-666(-)|eukprot:CAMPEP_0183303634 /NCGR_PEP_ID=MMETSP0160_2-20130417/8994_1 /TAXON_ID=2839 ORGANISM="Odontella Sinensis, Strain Grunow 1884" /NCGR_SAMPLE_ID=MMETSP0160_2 /ASSEMBLY_ACC=CAM_ASM_000250 /LENGTH=196 /DNA_ID=CAMNT_0025466559 /DNA_START=57 /DNA_END=647 /DNA_ORIENTATION=-
MACRTPTAAALRLLHRSTRRPLQCVTNFRPATEGQRAYSESSILYADAAAAKVAASGEGTSNETLLSPKVDELYNKMIALDREQLDTVGHILIERFGIAIDLSAPIGDVAATSEDETGAEEVKEEKTAFDLKLLSFDAKAKIKVIKEVRAITGLGLKEAKEVVEGAPKVIKKDIKMEDAEELKKKLEEVGAAVEIA